MKAMSSTARQIIFWLLIIAGALLLYKLVNPNSKNSSTIDLTQLEQKIMTVGELKSLTIEQNEAVAVDARGLEFRAPLTNEHIKADVLKEARELVNGTKRVDNVDDKSGTSSYLCPIPITAAPFLFLIATSVSFLTPLH